MKGGGLTKREGRSVLLVALAQTFTFFTSSPLSQWFLKSAMAVPDCDWWIFVRSSRSLDLSPPYRAVFSLLSLFLTPFLRSLFRASLSNTYGPFCSLAEGPLSFSRFIPSRTDNLPLQQPLRHFWARQESLCN